MANYTETQLNQIWLKSTSYSLLHDMRKDRYGSLMRRNEYGNRNSLYGWEVDHIIPLAKGGLDVLSNWQPLNWQNNAQKSDNKHPPLSSILMGRSLLS